MRVLLVWNGATSRSEADPSRRRRIPLAVALTRHGIEPCVVLLDDQGGMGDLLEARGIDVVHVVNALPPHPRALVRMPSAVRALRRIVTTRHPAVVDASEPMPAIAAALAAARTGIPVCYRRHHAGGRPPLHLASRLAAKLTDRTIVSNRVMRRCASEQDGTPLTQIDVTPSGLPEPTAVSSAAVAAVRRSLGLAPQARVILNVGRFRREKGLDLLLDAIHHLGDPGNLHLVLLGDGPEAGALRARAGRLGLPVHMPGHVAEVQPWLAIATMMVMPSRRESFGQATLEAMAAGLPLVASAVGGLQEAVAHEVTGLLVPPEDPHALAAAIRRLLDDTAQARQMGAAGQERYLAHYTLEHMAEGWAAAWRRLLAREEVLT